MSLILERDPRAAYSLVELLVVVAILATVAGGMVVTLASTETHAATDLARRDLATLKQAILQFRQDTGFLPKQGPFALAGHGEGQVPIPADEDPADFAAWFHSPANLSQLVENPLADVAPAHPLAQWDPDTRRGWRGPYLSRPRDGWVRVGAGLDPTLLTAPPLLAPVPGLADPFKLPAAAGGAFAWTNSAGQPLHCAGRPYLLLALDDPDHAQVVGLGPDGLFDSPGPGLEPDDLVLHLLR